MNQIRELLIKEIGLKNEHFIKLESLLKPVELKRKQHLLQVGQTCSFIGFVESGILRSYILKEGDEFNMDFYLPGTFVSSYTSFLTRTPTRGSIQALSDSVIHTLSYEDYTSLLNSDPEWFRLGKHIADILFIKKCNRENSLLKDSAADRYELLLRTYPGIEQLVAQYQIASYLGIKPESLSRIKSLTYINE